MRTLVMILVTAFVLCGLGGPVTAQSYPKAKKKKKQTSSSSTSSSSKKDKAKPKVKAPKNSVSGTLSKNGKTMNVADGLAVYYVSENRVAKTRKPVILIFVTDKKISTSQWDEIRELVPDGGGLYKIDDLFEQAKVGWGKLEISFDPGGGLYKPEAARWYHEDYSWNKSSGSSTSIMGDGIKKLPGYYPLLDVNPDQERLKLKTNLSGWKVDMDVTMWVKQKY